MEALASTSFFSPIGSLSSSLLPSKSSQITISAIDGCFSLSNQFNRARLKPINKSWRYPLSYVSLCSHTDFQELSKSSDDRPSENVQLAILLEVEGVLVDVHRSANRQAFNLAFRKIGLDCANWTEPIYADLTRKAGGDEEQMITLYFNKIGWPSSLPTNEKRTFMENVLREKKKALEEFAASNKIPLRPGAESFIDDALNEGIPVVFVTTYSKNGDKLSRCLIENLDHELISKVKIVGKKEVEDSFYGQLVFGKGTSASLDEQIAKEAGKAVSAEKQRVAKEVASILKLSVDLDTTPAESLENIVATLRAGAEYAGVSVNNCVLVAGCQSGVTGAERISMPCIVLRSSLTARAEFQKAKAVMDGFGGADLTVSKLYSKKRS